MAKKVKALESLEEVKESVVASPEVSGEVAKEMEILPETIKGRKVLSVGFVNGLHTVTDEDRTTYSLPPVEFNEWKLGKMFV